MVDNKIDMTPQSLHIRIHLRGVNKWYQVGLFASPTIQLNAGYPLDQNPLAKLNWNELSRIGGGAARETHLVEIRREESGQIAMIVDNEEQRRGMLPECYVYVDIFHTQTQAEIL